MVRVRFGQGPAALSQRAQKAFQLAHQEAHRLNHRAVGTEHLLLGLAKEGGSPAAIVLRQLGFDLEWLRQQIELMNPPEADPPAQPGALPYTHELASFLELIVAAAESSRVIPLTPEYVLAALVREPDGAATRILQQRKVALWRLRRKLKRVV